MDLLIGAQWTLTDIWILWYEFIWLSHCEVGVVYQTTINMGNANPSGRGGCYCFLFTKMMLCFLNVGSIFTQPQILNTISALKVSVCFQCDNKEMLSNKEWNNMVPVVISDKNAMCCVYFNHDWALHEIFLCSCSIWNIAILFLFVVINMENIVKSVLTLAEQYISLILHPDVLPVR